MCIDMYREGVGTDMTATKWTIGFSDGSGKGDIEAALPEGAWILEGEETIVRGGYCNGLAYGVLGKTQKELDQRANRIAASPTMLEALKDAESTLCACRFGNTREADFCNCDIHAARRIMLAAIREAEEGR